MWKVGPDQSARASELMRHVVANYAEARTKAEVLRKEVREKYTWDLAAERVAEALKD
jgi:hypothetical protein